MSRVPGKAGLGRVLAKFALETNIEGVNNAGRSHSGVRKAAWLVIFTFLGALTVSDLVSLTEEYLGNPVDVATTIDHKVSPPHITALPVIEMLSPTISLEPRTPSRFPR
jgi:hypothetical protein